MPLLISCISFDVLKKSTYLFLELELKSFIFFVKNKSKFFFTLKINGFKNDFSMILSFSLIIFSINSFNSYKSDNPFKSLISLFSFKIIFLLSISTTK